MTVEELADVAGVSAGLISQLERGIGNPSFNTLMRLSRALGLPIVAFFQGANEYESERIIVRRHERRNLVMAANGDDDGHGLQQELLTPVTNRKLGLVWTTVPPQFSTEETPMAHIGEEVFLVIEGELIVYLDGHGYRVGTGDSISFDSSVPHAYANPTRQSAVFLGCSTPPTTAGCYSDK
ncbi:cupin domain-containing protein [Rhizohabitans arisaemae]|uniref:cupin domain-containing protein n=1 Tax=Rhizohabitans arisaemae TaxID=2720610 RepID=UPI0024B0E5B5|nr:cupin domain-containing protein [Rhizohabitans arisaemae]